jgi:hypothetical protein
MNLSTISSFFKDNKTNILLAALCILFAWLIINWFRYLINNYYILKGTGTVTMKGIEGFESNIYSSIAYDNPNTPLTTHSVDLPINTNYTCSNFCNPSTATCSKTGQQCSTDVDCHQYGCESLLKPPTIKQVDKVEDGPTSDNDAGILTYNQTPQYSVLTTDIGTNATVINKDAELVRPYEGIPVWEETYDKQAQMINDELAYKYSAAPEQYRTAPFYPVATTITGVFYDIGPTPSNATNV